MIVQVIYDESKPKSDTKVVETLVTADAMRAHGEAILRKERYDRNELTLGCFVDNVFKSPADTVVIIENEINKTHRGIITGFSFSITPETVDISYTAEVIYEQ